ncbi:TIGR00730 family Rossman fold protein [Thermithiobacillus plumbiphilus]|uniref:Cytokinin riboside 5'-monophosphate phosphoribohydrolase n=1 Tax=Thermithiobacillus plumbiphilus TaxID=1729899 RepID=A0ABU9D4A3_9PROT
MRSICVFCGSRAGAQPVYQTLAEQLGRHMARQGIRLIYGGGHVGLMGVIADSVLAAGGKVTGVIPQMLMDREVGHRNLTRLHVVGSMHERKAMMAELAEGFIAMPGGIGTFEELFEIWTWAQLGLHRKPIGLLNAGNYYDDLLRFLDHAEGEGFLGERHRQILMTDEHPERLLQSMRDAVIPPETPVISLEES